jgi:hypothetical protein
MKRFISMQLIIAIVAFAFIINGTANAQSDREKTDKFKSSVQKIEEAVKNAKDVAECKNLEIQVDKLRNEFKGDKVLLDKSLYPDDFNASLEKLSTAITLRKGDFTQIHELKTEVVGLKDQVTDLNKKNYDLIGEIRILNLRVHKSEKANDSLKTLVAQLRASLKERDKLVMGMVDSLLTEFTKSPSGLNETEQQGLVTTIKNKNLFFNIQRTINDNIKFMEVTQLKADDISEMKKQQVKFSKLWRQMGPKLAQVYLSKKESMVQIDQINSLFTSWNLLINNQLWGNVDKVFKDKNVKILPYTNGEQFSENIKGYILDEIKNMPTVGKDQSLKEFKLLSDTVWFDNVKKEWVPVLIENGMLTAAQKDTIEANLAQWQKQVEPPFSFTWIYVAIGALLVVIAAAYIALSRKKKAL